MDLLLFDEVGEIVQSMAPDGLGPLRLRSHRRGIKVWYGPKDPVKEHYEAQFIPRRHVDGADGVALEIGFHAEHRDEAANEAALAAIIAQQASWQRELGEEATPGPFLGNTGWRRISDVWLDVDPEDPELGLEIASRLVDYLELLEPLRRTD